MTRKIGSRYVVTRVLGRGTCGTVWEGTGPDGPVAVKLLREDLAADQALVARFVQERTVLTSLDHPNIVGITDLVVDGTDLALVMDLVRGSDLRQRLDLDGPLAPRRAAAVVADVAAALAAAHARGIIHRDVKPENVMLDAGPAGRRPGGGSERARLTDFGIARLVDGPRRTRATRIIGTPDYLAPEVIEGLKPGPPVDVYALGTLLFELLTGWTPFGGGHPGAVLRRHVTEPVPQLPGVPRPLVEIVGSCLAKAPAARLTAAEVAERLRAVLPELPATLVARIPNPREEAGHDDAEAVPAYVGAVPLIADAGFDRTDDSRATHVNLMRPIKEVQPRPRGAHGARSSSRRRRLLIGVGIAAAVAAGIATLGYAALSGGGQPARQPGNSPTVTVSNTATGTAMDTATGAATGAPRASAAASISSDSSQPPPAPVASVGAVHPIVAAGDRYVLLTGRHGSLWWTAEAAGGYGPWRRIPAPALAAGPAATADGDGVLLAALGADGRIHEARLASGTVSPWSTIGTPPPPASARNSPPAPASTATAS